MHTPKDIADAYIALWNEPDTARRSALLEQDWDPAATYRDPLMQGAGHAEIDGLVAAVRQRFPGLRFAVVGSPDGHGAFARFSWALGPADGAAIVKGTDIVAIRDGRIASVVGFLDLVPAAA